MRSLWFICPLAAIWAIALGRLIVAIPVFLAWLGSGAGGQGPAEVVRISGIAWVVIHDVPVRVGSATYSLMPWGLAVIPFLLLWQSGRWAARVSDVREVHASLSLIGGAAAVYAAAVATACWIVSSPQARISTPRAFITAFMIASIALALGVYRRSPAGERLRQQIPPSIRVVLGGSSVGLAALVSAGAFLAAASLVRTFPEVVAINASLDAGPIGGLALLMLGIGYIPILTTWAVAYSAGAGVTIGQGIVLSPFTALPQTADLPPFPLLAALPTRSLAWSWLPMAVGIVAGLLIGWYVARSAPRPVTHRVALAMSASMLAGLGMAFLAVMSHGHLGEERLTGLGPQPPVVATAVTGLLLAGSMPSALMLRPRRGRAPDSA
jgi:hypothetical protein